MGVVDISLGVETGEGGASPSHLTVVELRSYRNVALPVSPSPVAIANGNLCMDMLPAAQENLGEGRGYCPRQIPAGFQKS